jgi:hypothetical protein
LQLLSEPLLHHVSSGHSVQVTPSPWYPPSHVQLDAAALDAGECALSPHATATLPPGQ